MAISIAVLTFWLGVFLVLSVEAILVYVWFVSKKVVKPPALTEMKPELPQVVEEIADHISEGNIGNRETCQFLNLGLSFLFQEVTDSTVVKRFIMRRIQKEFEDFMMTKTQGRIVEQLIVRDYSVGKQFPVFHYATVTDVRRSKEDLLESIDVTLDVDYEGGAQICIDADLILGKCAFVSVKVCKVKGQGRLQFTRDPCTSWSFSFYDTPEVQLEVECQLDGRQFNQLSGFLENQIHKWVKKKYTLPNYKPRFLPFFPQPVPQDQRVEIYLHDNKLTVGQLEVELVECSRLVLAHCPAQMFCSLQLAEVPCQPLSGMWRTLWPVVECSVARPTDGGPIGVIFVETSWRDKDEDKHELVVAKTVTPDSLAGVAGMCKGDVICSVNHIKVTTVKSVLKLLHKISTKRFLFSMMRPPLHALSYLLSNVGKHKKQHKQHVFPAADSEGAVQEMDKLAAPSPKLTKKKKESKGALRQTDKLHRRPLFMFGSDLDPNLHSECVVESYDASCPSDATEARLRRQTASLTDWHSSVDDSHCLKSSSRELLTRSTSAVTSRSIDHVDPQSSAAGPTMDCVDSVIDQQLTSGHNNSCSTSLQSACQNPQWKERFKFSVSPTDQYLNITLWYQLEDEKDLAVAHVSISLVDVALQCLSTSSCTHTQRYVFLLNEAVKFGSSRSVIKLTGSRGIIAYEGVYGGDVLLKLTHFTEHRRPPEVDATSDVIEQDVEELSDHQEISDNSDEETNFGEHVLLQNEPAEMLKTNHDFQLTEVKNVPAQCTICSKKFWRHRVLQCVHCKLFCHKKCSSYCMRQVPCYRKTCGYHIEMDDDAVKDDRDFDQSVSSQLSTDIVSGSETESEAEFPPQHTEAEIRCKLKIILAEMDSIKDTYNEIGMTKADNVEEAKSIMATQENLTVQLDHLKQQMLTCYAELNRLDDDI